MTRPRQRVALALAVGLAALLPAGAPAASPAPAPAADRITLVTHDSFALTPEVLAVFTERTGVAVEILTAGDAGSLVNQSILAGDRPLGDVIFGIDDAFLSRALDAGILEPYRPAALAEVPAALVLDPEGRATPIDYGDVCLNVDLAAFGGDGPPLPTTLDDLLLPAYRDLLVVQDAATSSPGLAFLLATIARYGEDGWRDYWAGLRANGLLVAADWTDAYYTRFSGGAGEGDRPIVVSYASSPVAEVIYADPRPATPPTGVIEDGCYRQIEHAGVLRGTDAPAEARAFVDFLLSPEVQGDIPLNMFVSPVLPGAPVPDDYRAFAVVPAAPLRVDPAVIAAERDRWIAEWTEVVLR
ncbi:MAG: thiamine ABC transporter substrate binding subunit [Chloroflexota bacterium]